jgi:hypothetical protein
MLPTAATNAASIALTPRKRLALESVALAAPGRLAGAFWAG